MDYRIRDDIECPQCGEINTLIDEKCFEISLNCKNCGNLIINENHLINLKKWYDRKTELFENSDSYYVSIDDASDFLNLKHGSLISKKYYPYIIKINNTKLIELRIIAKLFFNSVKIKNLITIKNSAVRLRKNASTLRNYFRKDILKGEKIDNKIYIKEEENFRLLETGYSIMKVAELNNISKYKITKILKNNNQYGRKIGGRRYIDPTYLSEFK